MCIFHEDATDIRHVKIFHIAFKVQNLQTSARHSRNLFVGELTFIMGKMDLRHHRLVRCPFLLIAKNHE